MEILLTWLTLLHRCTFLPFSIITKRAFPVTFLSRWGYYLKVTTKWYIFEHAIKSAKFPPKNLPLSWRARYATFQITDAFIGSRFLETACQISGLIVHLTMAKKKSKRPALIYKPSLKCFLLRMVLQNILIAPWVPSLIVFEVLEPCAEAQYVLISGAFVSHFICTESCAIIIQWFTLCSQNTHSYLLRGCRDTVRQLWVGGWVGDRESERKTLALLWETTFLSSSQHEATEHPDFKSFRSWIFTLVAFYHV